MDDANVVSLTSRWDATVTRGQMQDTHLRAAEGAALTPGTAAGRQEEMIKDLTFWLAGSRRAPVPGGAGCCVAQSGFSGGLYQAPPRTTRERQSPVVHAEPSAGAPL